jgi:hypothetical protein
MVLETSEYNEDYFNGRNTGTKFSWGYADIRENGQLNKFDEGNEVNPYNANIKNKFSHFEGNQVLSNFDLLDVGGCIGNYSHYGKKLGIRSWDILDLNIDGWCEANKLLTVDNFITGDARIALADKILFKNNAYDVLFSVQFLECIDDADLPGLITEMNRVTKSVQIHFVSNPSSIDDIPSQSKYNLKTLEEWKALNWEVGTQLINFHTGELVNT